MKGLLHSLLHNWRIKNTGDAQLQAYNDFWNEAGPGTVLPSTELITNAIHKSRRKEGNEHIGYSGIPEFLTGQGTKSNPLVDRGNAVGVTGFYGGSDAKYRDMDYMKAKYLDGLFRGMAVEELRDVENGELTEMALYHTDKGTYDLKPKWYDWKYRTK